jgi:hypothetical protein
VARHTVIFSVNDVQCAVKYEVSSMVDGDGRMQNLAEGRMQNGVHCKLKLCFWHNLPPVASLAGRLSALYVVH